MKVVILCGGAGTRIRQATEDIPKPMIKIGGYPILWHIMKYYAHFGHNKFILCLGYKGEVIKDYFLKYETEARDFTIRLGDAEPIFYHTKHDEAGWEITLVDTGLSAMTGARIKKTQQYLIDEENFMLTYGDGLGDIDLDKVMAFHFAHKKILTVTGVSPPGRFGELCSDSLGVVTSFQEKPPTGAGRISGGFFLCHQRLFDYLDDRDDLVFEDEPLRRLVEDRQMMVYEHNGFWQPMDTYSEFLLLKELYDHGRAPWMIWKTQSDD